MGIRECDDGNRVDKDGCSSDCRVERNYRCRGGGTTTKDKCQKILPISGDVNLKIDSIINSEKGSLAIEFDEKVKLNPKHQADFKEKIKVFLNGTCESYDLKYQIVLVQDRFGWESIKINYAIDFNIPENS
jgi:cysteine-rich repeat protein